MQIAVNSIRFLLESRIGFDQIGIAWVLWYEIIRLIPVVVSCLIDQRSLEFLFVNTFGLKANFDEHLYTFLYILSFNHFSISLFFNFSQQQIGKAFFDLAVLDHVSLELIGLHGLDVQEIFHFWYEILVHIEQNVLDHNYNIFFQLPNFIDFLNEVLIWYINKLLSYWL